MPTVRGGADALRAVDAKADVAVATHRRLAAVHAHPDADLALRRPCEPGQRALCRGRSGYGSARAGEAREHGVPLRIHDLATRVGDRSSEDPFVLGEDGAVVVAQTLQQARRPLDVREEKGDRPGRERAHGPQRSYAGPRRAKSTL